MMLIITGQSKNMQGVSLLVFSTKNIMSIHTTLKHEDVRKQQGQLSTASTIMKIVIHDQFCESVVLKR